MGDHLVLELEDLSYRLCPDGCRGLYLVEKKRAGKWRKDNSYRAATLADLVRAIEAATAH
jgi:hypothetical protein